ncbi:unnamed protein product [Adineta ricciae]|uniref:CUB domain-containing protein n=1 Tax=Adineta ricciae TaxID=249248 RepID=A0A815KUR4_ADIRI|nr:unnamed protein product [Adineta ricciae]CAF1487078.1 unnamed protein product [Adineta ricciae]
MLTIKATILFCLVLLPIVSWARSTGSQYSSPNMEKNCGKTITLDGDKLPGTYFSLTSGNYKPNVDCILTIKGKTSNQRIIVVVDKMDVACGGDKIIIYDGKIDQGSVLNKNQSEECGTKKYYLRTITSNTAIIQFISNNDKKVGTGFTINTAINFPVSTCSRIENLYRCKNNYCISNSFNCDDRNWCGDNTQQHVCR